MMKRVEQDPQEKRLYDFVVSGDTVTAGAWVVTPAVSGGINGEALITDGAYSGSRALFGPAPIGTYLLTCHLTGASTQQYERSIQIVVKDL